jgi:glycosyltransferase involved in cell wall biosynthesis
MLRILHISNTDIEHDNRIRKELKALSQLPGVQVSVLGVPDVKDVGDVELDGAHYRKMHMASRMLKSCPRALHYFVELIEFTFKMVAQGRRLKPDIVHCHDTFALPAGLILKRRMGCQLVYDAHELESDKNGQNKLLSWATLLIEKACWKQVDLLISVSDSITAWYMRKFGPKPNVLVLNSPAIAVEPDPQFSTQARGNYFHEKYAIPSDSLVFVYLGLFCTGRGIQILLDAFAQGTKDAHVVFIGFGYLEKTIVEYSKQHANIHFHEAVPHDQVVSLVRNADYGLSLIEKVSLSDYYCLPNKLFEYCFARVPVLASGFPEIKRMVEQYSLGVCCDPDPDSVRAALGQMIKHRAPRVTSDITALGWEAQAARLTAAYRDKLMTALGPRAAI